ncbi:MAG: hypothetical protein QM739_10815 [Propionivibrio sp.]
MNNTTRAFAVSICLLASGATMADDAVWGALLGGGAGAAIGGSVSGRNGAIVGGALGAAAGTAIATDNNRRRVEYVPPAPVYLPRTVYYSEQPVYYAAPVRVVTPTVYYVAPGFVEHRHHSHREKWRRTDGRWYGYR